MALNYFGKKIICHNPLIYCTLHKHAFFQAYSEPEPKNEPYLCNQPSEGEQIIVYISNFTAHPICSKKRQCFVAYPAISQGKSGNVPLGKHCRFRDNPLHKSLFAFRIPHKQSQHRTHNATNRTDGEEQKRCYSTASVLLIEKLCETLCPLVVNLFLKLGLFVQFLSSQIFKQVCRTVGLQDAAIQSIDQITIAGIGALQRLVIVVSAGHCIP